MLSKVMLSEVAGPAQLSQKVAGQPEKEGVT